MANFLHPQRCWIHIFHDKEEIRKKIGGVFIPSPPHPGYDIHWQGSIGEFKKISES